MAKEIKTIDYDSVNDILFISDESKIMSTLDLGEFILDINKKNFIGGIEVMNASENLGINKENLGRIKSIHMSVNYKTNNIYILLVIIFQKENKEVNMSIPLSLSLGHKIPKKEVLVYN